VKRILIVVAVGAAALAFATSAFGGTAIVTGHNASPPTTASLGTTGSGTPAGTLPFTGVDLAGIVIVAALLVGGGLILRRTANRTH
jgi:hypothetical protein